MSIRVLIFSREKFGWLRVPSSPSKFSISLSKEICYVVTPSIESEGQN